MKKLCWIIVLCLAIAGCSLVEESSDSGSSENQRSGQRAGTSDNQASSSPPDYEIISQEDFYIGNSGMMGKELYISTEATDETDYRAICEELRTEFPDSPALSVGYYEPLNGREFDPSDIEGTCQWYQDEGVASFMLGPGYSEQEVERIMQEDDGYFIISLGELEQEISGMMEETT